VEYETSEGSEWYIKVILNESRDAFDFQKSTWYPSEPSDGPYFTNKKLVEHFGSTVF
jgi:hypothetical protein